MRKHQHINLDHPVNGNGSEFHKALFQWFNPRHNPAITEITEKIGPWSAVILDRTRTTTTIRVMTDQRGTTLDAITRHRDGSVTRRVQGKTITGMRLKFETSNVTQPAKQHAGQLITTQVMRDHPDLMTRILADPQRRSEILHAIRNSADRVLNQCLLNPAPQPPTVKVAPNPGHNVEWQATQLLHDQILDQQVLNTANDLFPTITRDSMHDLGDIAYNTIALNKKVFRKLQRTAPKILLHYCDSIVPDHPKAVKLRHPGQVVEAVRSQLNLTPAQWRIFCRAPHRPRQSDQDPEEHLENIRLACAATAEANQPQADQERLEMAWYRLNHHRFFYQAQWDHGSPWQAWTNLISRFLDPESPPRSTGELDSCIDALRHHVEHQLPWGPGDWGTLLRRSQQWHQQLLQQRHGTDPGITWQSLLASTSINGVEFRPVTDSHQLHTLGTRMQNCLGSYTTRCRENHCRIFTAHREGHLQAALELQHSNGHWSVGQLEGHSRSTVHPDISIASQQLAQAYQHAHDQRPTGTSNAPEET